MKSLAVVVTLMMALLPLTCAAADDQAIVTILEGTAVIYRAASKLAAAEGVGLRPDDLVETGNDTFARIEFADGTRLDLGPTTRLQLNRAALRKLDRPALYILSGWIKLATGDSRPGSDPVTRAPAPAGTAPAFASPRIDCLDVGGTVVAHLDADTGAVFVEQGHARLLDRRVRATGTVLPVLRLQDGHFASWSKDDSPTLSGHPAAQFVQRLPQAFRNSIPARYERYAGRELTARSLGVFGYGEIEAWVNAEPSIRRQFVRTWRSRADDPAFRAGLQAGLDRHPEWEPVLFPERYVPAPQPRQAAPRDALPMATPGVALSDRSPTDGQDVPVRRSGPGAGTGVPP